MYVPLCNLRDDDRLFYLQKKITIKLTFLITAFSQITSRNRLVNSDYRDDCSVDLYSIRFIYFLIMRKHERLPGNVALSADRQSLKKEVGAAFV